jgi:hypothetical protein
MLNVFAEELRLQRNPENYALLRRNDVTSSSCSPASSASITTASASISSNAAAQQQQPSLQQTQATSTLSLATLDSMDDKRDFLITKVSLKDVWKNYVDQQFSTTKCLIHKAHLHF